MIYDRLNEMLAAGGVGGSQRILALCTMPQSVAGCCGVMHWAECEDVSEDNSTPPLLPNAWNIAADAVIEPARNKMTLRKFGGAVARPNRLPSNHKTTSLMDFRGQEWELPDDGMEAYVN